VAVGVLVGTGVGVDVAAVVAVGVALGVAVADAVGVVVTVAVPVGVGVNEGVEVGVLDGVSVGRGVLVSNWSGVAGSVAVAVLGVLVARGVTDGSRVLVILTPSIVPNGVSVATAGGKVGAASLSTL
jgi:hypothetical protein